MQSGREDDTPPHPADAATLAALRARLQARARVPDLPPGWSHESAALAAHGVAYGGDFVVAAIDGDRHLHMVLVDVCGSGTAAVPAALQFAGALQGLIGVVPAAEVLPAANAFLLRQPSDESLATAVQVELDLDAGDYVIRSAGHPPALRWSASGGEWLVDNARGTALGVTADAEVHESCGTLGPGEALMFYTDGVVESRSAGIDDGIAWLRRAARDAVAPGWDGVSRRVVDQVERGDDDRAILVLRRH